jgi:hypothetical protein
LGGGKKRLKADGGTTREQPAKKHVVRRASALETT